MLFIGQEKATKRSKYILAGITYGVHFSNWGAQTFIYFLLLFAWFKVVSHIPWASDFVSSLCICILYLGPLFCVIFVFVFLYLYPWSYVFYNFISMPWPLIGKLGSIRSAGAEASGQCPIEKTNTAGQGTITDSRQTQTPRDICIGPGELWHSLSCVSFVPQPTQILFRISKNFKHSDILMDDKFMFHFFSFMRSF